MKFKSIRSRLNLWYIVILGLIILITDIFLYKSFRKNIFNSIDDTLYAMAEEIEHTILKFSQETWKKEIRDVRDEFLTSRFFTQILEIQKGNNFEINRITKSEVLGGCIFPNSKNDIIKRIKNEPEFINATYKSLSVHPIRIIYFPVVKDKERILIVQVGTSLQKAYQSLDDLLVILLIAGPLMLFLSSFGGYIILNRAINPVKDVVKMAKKITTENLSERIELYGKEDEIGQLIQTFNEMIARLEKSVIQIKQFSSDVSHELKTPLTLILGEIELTTRRERIKEEYKKSLMSIYEDAKRLAGVIDNLLLLSTIDFQKELFAFEKIPLFEILIENLNTIQSLVDKKKQILMVKRVDPFYIKGDRTLLKLLIMNIAKNAIKYTPEKGKIEISLIKNNNTGLLKIKDNGIGISKESLPLIFDRFYRVDQSRSSKVKGFGLGLSIVKRITDFHRARIEVESKIKKGTTVAVYFPIHNSP